ncbi:hypothetical protein FGB62_27g01 [Gracilaria domingensis]|nr:hypothetical protein FGB62_27g01 [Gracilaria domingensis]
MFSLGCILSEGTDGVPRDVKRAVELYEQAITKGQSEDAVNKLALLLVKGDDSVPADEEQAVQLYETSIERVGFGQFNDELGPNTQIWNEYNTKRSSKSSIFVCSSYLVEPDPKRAFGLCECVIKERNEKGAINCMAKLVSYAHKEIPIDAKRADMLYQQLVDEENDEAAMVGTGELLWNGLEELSSDQRRAIERCARPIKEAESDGGPRSTSAVMHRLPDEDVPTDRTWAIKLCNESTDANQHVFGKLTLASFEVLVSV